MVTKAQPLRCPVCGSNDVRTSHKFRLRDIARVIRGYGAKRCRACRTRFHSKHGVTLLTAPSIQEDRISRSSLWAFGGKRRTQLWVLAAALSLFLLLLYLISLDPPAT